MLNTETLFKCFVSLHQLVPGNYTGYIRHVPPDVINPAFLPINKNKGLDNFELLGAGSLDSLNCGAASGGYVIDNRHPLTRLNIAFNPADHPVIFAGFANGKSVYGLRLQFGGKRGGDCQRIGTKG